MTVTLGPLSLPAGLLAVFAAIILGSAAGNRVAAIQGVKAEASLWLVIAGAVLAARAAYVAQYWSFYAAELWRIPDLRDGGLMPAAGIAAAVLIAGFLAWQKAGQRHALLVGMLTGVLVYGIGTGLIRMSDQRQALPSMTLADLEGRSVPLASFTGKPLVINIWASWCPPCRREMPALGEAQRLTPDVNFVFVNQGESAAAIRAYLQDEGLSLRSVMLDPTGMLAKATGSPGLPTTLFFDAKGILVDKRMGELSPATLAEYLGALRGGKPSHAQQQEHP